MNVSTVRLTRISRIRSRKVTVEQILCYILSLFIILSGSMYQYVESYSFPRHSIIMACMSLLCVAYIILSRTLSKKSIIYLLTVLSYLSIYILVTGSKATSYISTFLIPIMILILTFDRMISRKHLWMFVDAFTNVILLISLVALFFWVFSSVLDAIHLPNQYRYFWASRYMVTRSFHGLYFQNNVQGVNLFGRFIYRNTAIWPEAPGSASFFTYALLFELIKNERKPIRVIILILATLSTLSTKGFLLLAEVLILYYVLFKEEKVHGNKKIIPIILAIIASAFSIYMAIRMKSAIGSFSTRIDSALAGFRTWLQHPLFGVGYSNNEGVLENSAIDRISRGISMGFTTLLGQGGLYLMGFVMYPYIALYKKLRQTIYYKYFLILAVVSFSDLIISNIYRTPYYISIIAFGYAVLILLKGNKAMSEKIGEQ